jgi:hypothetical protein
VPGTGFNIAVPTPAAQQQWMLLQPAGPLASGTITFPLNTLTPDGTEILISSTQNITAFSIGLNGASAIFGNVLTLSAGAAVRYRFYQATNSWYAITSDPSSTLPATVQAFLANPTSANLRAAMTDETGTGLLVFNDTPTLITPILGTVTSGNISACTSTSMVMVTPILGTPTSGTLTNCTGLPVSTGVSGLGANVATALAINVGTAGAPVVQDGALGTPSSATLTNATGLPIATGVSGLGANVATFLATPSSADLAAAVTDETGTGALVFADSPTLVTPNIGVATATSVTTGPVFGSVQSLTGPGAVNLTTYTTEFTSTGTGDALTLADGASGQIKNVVYVAQTAGTDTGILTPANLGGYTTITFNDPGDSVQLQFIGTQWWVISAFGAVVA